MNLQSFLKLVRTRWVTVFVTTLIGLAAASVISLLTTPLYQASTRLFVSTPAGESLFDVYQGNLFSQQRVVSYTQLLMGQTLAQRTIDKLGLDMSAADLQKHVTATAKPDTVLINVDVVDKSAVRARDIANTLSDEFVQFVGELETPTSGAKAEVRVIVEQHASTPHSPVVPKTVRNIGLGLAAGLLLGLGLAVLHDVLDNTVKDREVLEELTHTGLVGSIPLDKHRAAEPAISFESDNSSIAEAFRKLRTNLQFLAVDHPPRVIVVASSVPNEGKSTTAINLALALAEAEHKVVLVDGDMRRPMLDKYLNLVGSAGFSTVLSGAASLSDVLQKSEFPGLTVLTSGPIPPNPSELLASIAAKRLLAELREQFDYVIIDSSPLLAVTDAALLAAGSDGVLLMTRFGSTKREQLSHSVRSLTDVGASVLGAVFTMVPSRGAAAYSYNYNYNYGDVPQDVKGRSHKKSTAGPAGESIEAANDSAR
ncbi:tyrosine-protein kinase domain-containing protein [Mycolicibacterium sphagni]|uniref:polysaccharide biosynthesis tyrosine autokinase n=1 Tax=Mycolicibacterium sphagni TaxID=1786 RepID=UPI0021F3C06D|nr:polysaccharide biosynthesis tyrosine autokinase [Mycolicibacterium sphagni]MCV7177496.1 polysaccharide biosynthesis tyrosine autokinase [Mycolicibacterium sphagni]